MDLLIVLISVAIILFFINLFLQWNYNYWKQRNIPYAEPSKTGLGNMKDVLLLRKTLPLSNDEIYRKFSDCKYVGYFTLRQPTIFIRDLELIRNILLRDFSFFSSNDVGWSEKTDKYLGKSPFVLNGERWKLIRSQLSPAFSSGRMKAIFPQMIRTSKLLVDHIETDLNKCVSAKELCAKYTVDSVASAILNLNIKSFENSNSEFHRMGRKAFNSEDIFITMKMLIYFFIPKLAEVFRIAVITDDVGNYFTNILKEQEIYRKENNAIYNDFLDYLLELRKKCHEYNFDEVHMTAHVLTFFTDGFETSSVAMSYVLYELALHTDIQNKLRNEVDDILEKYNGEFTYEGVMQEMKYADAVIQESLRLHPPLGFLRKKSTKPYTLPPPKEGGKEFQVDVNTPIIIPIYSIMRDAQYFSNPDHFDPDRFTDERKDEIIKTTFLTFGEGPRQCIGMRFALMQLKIGIVSIIRHYEVRLHSRTQVPLKDDPTSMFLKPVGGIWLTFHKRNEFS